MALFPTIKSKPLIRSAPEFVVSNLEPIELEQLSIIDFEDEHIVLDQESIIDFEDETIEKAFGQEIQEGALEQEIIEEFEQTDLEEIIEDTIGSIPTFRKGFTSQLNQYANLFMANRDKFAKEINLSHNLQLFKNKNT